MRIVFIHSGLSSHESLGTHYEQLIIKKYLALSTHDKIKYRSIQALPRKHIIGVALIDQSFWFTPHHLNNPWAHGPYCYHILDAIRLDEPISHGGKPGIWPISKNSIKRIESMPRVMSKINEWIKRYKISQPSSKLFYALTIFQPFAEAIVRKLRDIENRRSATAIGRIQDDCKQGENDSLQGCRICIERQIKRQINENQNSNSSQRPGTARKWLSFDYERYGKPFQRELAKHGHAQLPKFVDTDFSYHPNASLTKCACPRSKSANATTISRFLASRSRSNDKAVSHGNRNRNQPHNHKHDHNHNTLERAQGRGNHIETRSRDQANIKALVDMGFSVNAATVAMDKYVQMEEAIDFCLKLQSVQDRNGCGYSEQLANKIKNKNESGRKRKLPQTRNKECEEEEQAVRSKRKDKKRKLNGSSLCSL